MGENIRLDDELAALTDSLLAGEETQVQAELQDLAQVVQQLRQVIAPDSPPEPAYRARLTQRLDREWTLRRQRHSQRLRSWYRHRLVQLTALAAGITLVLLTIALLSSRGQKSDDVMQGTAFGSFAWAFGIMVALVGVGLFLLWFRQRWKS